MKIPISHRCGLCNRTHDSDSWVKLPFVGASVTEVVDDEEAIVVEFRNCPCGNTLARRLPGVWSGDDSGGFLGSDVVRVVRDLQAMVTIQRIEAAGRRLADRQAENPFVAGCVLYRSRTGEIMLRTNDGNVLEILSAPCQEDVRTEID